MLLWLNSSLYYLILFLSLQGSVCNIGTPVTCDPGVSRWVLTQPLSACSMSSVKSIFLSVIHAFSSQNRHVSFCSPDILKKHYIQDTAASYLCWHLTPWDLLCNTHTYFPCAAHVGSCHNENSSLTATCQTNMTWTKSTVRWVFTNKVLLPRSILFLRHNVVGKSQWIWPAVAINVTKHLGEPRNRRTWD